MKSIVSDDTILDSLLMDEDISHMPPKYENLSKMSEKATSNKTKSFKMELKNKVI